jgi:hypothetical protein
MPLAGIAPLTGSPSPRWASGRIVSAPPALAPSPPAACGGVRRGSGPEPGVTGA